MPEAALQNVVAAPVVVLDRDGRIVRWSSACQQLSGYSFEEVRGKHFWDVALAPEEVAAVKAVFAGLSAGRPERLHESCWVTKDGTRRSIAWTSTAVLGPDGQRLEQVIAAGAVVSERNAAEEALKRSQESLARAQAIARIGDWERDVVTNQVIWSDQMSRLMGMSLGAPLAGYEDFLNLVHPDDRERVKEAARAAVAAGVPYSADYRMVRKDGTTLFVHARAELLRDEHGRPRRLVGTVQDITERSQAEAAVRASEERFRLILESSAEGIFGVDLTGACSFANRAFAEMLGYKGPDELLGRDLHALIHHTRADGSPFPAEECPGMRALKACAAVHVEDDLFWRADGTPVRVEYRIRPILQGGNPAGTVSNVRDIGQRKRAEEAEHFLSEASKVLASSLDYSATLAQVAQLAVPRLADWCIVLVAEEDGSLRPVKVTCADPAKADLARAMGAGYSPPPAAASFRVLQSGQSELTSELTDEDLVATAGNAEHLATLRRAGIRSRIAVPLVTEGRRFGVLIFAAAESGRRYGREDLALAEEVGRRAALAVTNARLYQLAQGATRAREELLAVVSHDLRTPLSVIVLQASLLQRTSLPAAAVKKIVSIRQAAARITLLISDLLDAATIEAEKLAIEPERNDLRSLVEAAIEEIRPLAEQGSLRLDWLVPEGLPPVSCDRRRVLRALGNLLANAVKFTPPGGAIQVRVEPRERAVCFAVTDTGAGIPGEALPHLFERYWQAERHQRAGAGLGLYIAKGIIEAHGGRVWAESKVNGGSSFFFTLPMDEPEGRAEAPAG